MGSCDIDEGGLEIFLNRLKRVQDDSKVSDDEIILKKAMTLVEGPFQRAKCRFAHHDNFEKEGPHDEETAEFSLTLSKYA